MIFPTLQSLLCHYHATPSWLCISLSVSEQLCLKFFYLIMTVNWVFQTASSTNRGIDSQRIDIRGNISLYLKSNSLLSFLGSSANCGSFLAKFSPPGALIIVKDVSLSTDCSFWSSHFSLYSPRTALCQTKMGETVCLGLKFETCFFSTSWTCLRPKSLMSYRRCDHLLEVRCSLRWDRSVL